MLKKIKIVLPFFAILIFLSLLNTSEKWDYHEQEESAGNDYVEITCISKQFLCDFKAKLKEVVNLKYFNDLETVKYEESLLTSTYKQNYFDGLDEKFVKKRKHRPQLPRMSLEEGNSGRKRF